MLTGFQQLTMAQANVQSTTKDNIQLGTLYPARDGSLYVWAQAGASNLAAGLVNVSPAKVANDTNRGLDSTSNVAVGVSKITVSAGGSVTADKYADGLLSVVDGAGVGQTLQIAGNSASYTGGAANAVDVYLTDPVITLLSISTTKVSLVPNPFSNLIVHPGSSTAFFPAGVNELAITAANYFWLKLRGTTAVLADGITAKGIQAVLTTNAIAGAVITQGSNTTVKPVGVAPEATVDTKYYPLFLTLI